MQTLDGNALQVINTSLPHPVCMYQTLDQLFLTGKDSSQYITITRMASLAEAAEKLLTNCLSCLPVINPDSAIVEDVLNKVDIMNFVFEHGWTDLSQRTVNDALVARYPVSFAKIITCCKEVPATKFFRTFLSKI